MGYDISPFMDGTPRIIRGKHSYRGRREEEEERAKRWSNLRGVCCRRKGGGVRGTGGTRDNLTSIGRPRTCSIDNDDEEVRRQTMTKATTERDPRVPTCLKTSKINPPFNDGTAEGPCLFLFFEKDRGGVFFRVMPVLFFTTQNEIKPSSVVWWI